VIGELCAGFAKGSRFEKNLRELDEFLALPVVETLAVDREIAELFGEMINELRRSGVRFRLTMSGSRPRACAPGRRC
jgi:predicted nucleic acid-binding protein